MTRPFDRPFAGDHIRSPWTDREQQEAERLKDEGFTYAAIASMLGRSPSTISRRLKPEVYERDRARARAYKAENQELIRKHNLDWWHKNKARLNARRRAKSKGLPVEEPTPHSAGPTLRQVREAEEQTALERARAFLAEQRRRRELAM